MNSLKNFLISVRSLVPLAMVSILICSGCVPTTGWGPQPPSDPAEALIYEGDKAAEKNKTTEALGYYDQFLSEYPEHPSVPDVLLRLGSLCNDAGDYSRAHQVLGELLEKYPSFPERDSASLGLCRSLYESGKREQGLDCIEKARNDFTAPGSRANLAVLYAEFLASSGKGMEAADSLEASLEELPASYHPQILETFFTITQSMAPNDIETLISEARQPEPAASITLAWGMWLVDNGHYRKAEKTLESFLTSFPGHRKKSEARKLLASIKEKKEEDANLLSVGALLPLSGRFASLGEQAMRGVEMAVALYGEEPEAGPIRVMIENTLSDNAATVTSLEKLDEERVLAAIGPIGYSSEALRSSTSLGIPLITFTQQDKVTEIGPNIFRNFLTPAMQVDRLVSFLIEEQGLSRFAILYPKDAYGEQFRNLFWDKVKNAGGEITGVEEYAPNATDFSGAIRKLKGLQLQSRDSSGGSSYGLQFEAIFIPDSADHAGLILPQLAYHGLDHVQIVGTNLWHSSKLLEIGKNSAIGAIFPSGFFAESKRPEVREFIAKYEETYQGTPGYLEAVAFDSMMILFHALEHAHGSRDNMQEFLTAMPPYSGVTGETSFSGTREAITAPYLLKVTTFGFTEITP